jgi:hypothetical protein
VKLIRKTGTLGVHPKHNWLVGGTARGTQDKVVGDSGGWALGTRAPAEGPPIASTEGGILPLGGLSPIFFRVFGLVPGPREVLKVLLDKTLWIRHPHNLSVPSWLRRGC